MANKILDFLNPISNITSIVKDPAAYFANPLNALKTSMLLGPAGVAISPLINAIGALNNDGSFTGSTGEIVQNAWNARSSPSSGQTLPIVANNITPPPKETSAPVQAQTTAPQQSQSSASILTPEEQQMLAQIAAQQAAPEKVTANYDAVANQIGNFGYQLDESGNLTGKPRVDAEGNPITTNQSRVLSNFGIDTSMFSPQEVAQLESAARMLEYAKDANQLATASATRTALQENNAALQNTLAMLPDEASDASAANVGNYFSQAMNDQVAALQGAYTEDDKEAMEEFTKSEQDITKANQENMTQLAAALAEAEQADTAAERQLAADKVKAIEDQANQLLTQAEYMMSIGQNEAANKLLTQWSALTGNYYDSSKTPMTATQQKEAQAAVTENAEELSRVQNYIDLTENLIATINPDQVAGVAMPEWMQNLGIRYNDDVNSRQRYRQFYDQVALQFGADYNKLVGNSPNLVSEMKRAMAVSGLPDPNEVGGLNNAEFKRRLLAFDYNNRVMRARLQGKITDDQAAYFVSHFGLIDPDSGQAVNLDTIKALGF
jgi:hypothetical protein